MELGDYKYSVRVADRTSDGNWNERDRSDLERLFAIGNSLIRQKNGDIAIGTNAPQAKLHVQVTTGTAVAGYTGGGVQGTNFAAGAFGVNTGTSGTGVYGLALANTGQATAI